MLHQALELRRESAPGTTRVASALSSLGRVLHAQGRLSEAESSFAEVLDLRLDLLGEDHLHVALTSKDLASVLFDLGKNADAEIPWDQALTVLRSEKPGGWEIADAESCEGARLLAAGRVEEAEALLERSYETLRRLRGEEAIYTRQELRRLEELQAALASR